MRNFFLSIILVLTALQPLSAEKKSYSISEKEGSEGSTTILYLDSEDRLWIGSWSGIIRFDGCVCKRFSMAQNGCAHLGNNGIMDFHEQSPGVYWVTTLSGVDLVDENSDESFQFLYDRNGSYLQVPPSLDISSDGNDVFVASAGVLYHYDQRSCSMQEIRIPGIPSEQIWHIFCVRESELLVLTYDHTLYGVQYRILDDCSFVVSDMFRVLENEAFLSARRSDDHIYLCSTDKTFDFNCRDCSISAGVEIPFNWNSPVFEKIDDSNALIAYKNFMYAIDFAGSKCIPVPSYGGKDVTDLCIGPQNILWIASNDEGVTAIYDDVLSFGDNSLAEQFGRSVGTVESIIEDECGDIYMGTSLGGICCPGRNLLLTSADGLSSDMVRGVSLVNGGFFVLTSTGIDFVASGDGAPRIYNLAPLTIASRSMYVDRACRTIWVESYGAGMQSLRYERQGCAYRIVGSEYLQPDSGENVTAILADSDPEYLIVGTNGHGVRRMHKKTGAMSDFEWSRPLAGEGYVNVLYRDGESVIWAGTNIGLARIEADGVRAKFDLITTDSQMIVNSIAETGDGKLWLGTERGIACYDKGTGALLRYASWDYMSNLRFSNAALTASDGTVCLGGPGGVYNRFDPAAIRPRNFCPTIYWGGFDIRDKGTIRIDPARNIVLGYKDNDFTVNFSARDYIRNADVRYYYMLEGMDDVWTDAGHATKASFTNVPSGHYIFRVRSTNGDGVACDNECSFPVTVRRPWLRSIPMLFVYALMAAALAVSLAQLTKRREQRKKEREMEELERRHQKETMEAKLDFFTDIAHEFGTPITIITGCSEQLTQSSALSQKSLRYVDLINESATRMQSLIQELMEFRKMDTEKIVFNYTLLNLSELVTDVISGLEASNSSKEIKMECDIPGEPVVVVSDMSALEKIFYNLVSNAFKYTPDRGTISCRLRQAEGGVSFVIRNTGKGIKPSEIGKVFDKYAILDSFSKQAKGENISRNGLGLALVKNLVDALSGKLGVSSVRGEYTEFSLFLPDNDRSLVKTVAEAKTIPSNVGIERLSAAKDGHQTILVADDEKYIRELISDILGDSYRLILASNGNEVLDALKFERPDLIITDLMMPELSGEALIGRLKENEMTKYIPIVVLSCKTEVDSMINNYRTGIEAYVTKPFHPRQLKAIVDRIISGRVEMKAYYNSGISNYSMLEDKKISIEDREFLGRFVKVIEENVSDEKMSVPEMASSLNVSNAWLYRKIKATSGMTPVEFVRKVKLNYAANLLKTTDLTILEVMYKSGFSNKSYFYKNFSAQYGMSPKSFRNNSL